MTTWVLLRGLTRESRHWGKFPEALRRALPGAEVHTPDLPGNGSLYAQESPCEVVKMVESVRLLLARQGIAPPYHLLAMSLGAMVAVDWAARYPEEISGCVLINTSLRPHSPFYRRLIPANYPRLLKLAVLGGNASEWESTILELTSHHAPRRADTLRHWVAYRHENPVTTRNALRQLFAAARYRAPLVQPRAPVLILASTTDGLVDSSCSRRLAQRWQAALAEHSSAGHDLPLDDAQWVLAQVRNWLATLSR